jgi:hypothetical protein
MGTTTSEYEHLTSAKKERQGNTETATVEKVEVDPDKVVLTLTFEWRSERERLTYYLHDDRDVLKLQALTDQHGFDFEQVAHLEGLTLELSYTGARWIPEAHMAYVEGEGGIWDTFVTELKLLGREIARTPKFLRRTIRGARTMSTRQLIIVFVLVKKVIVVGMLAYILL